MPKVFVILYYAAWILPLFPGIACVAIGYSARSETVRRIALVAGWTLLIAGAVFVGIRGSPWD